jgi:protein-arginine kinase activator protein McsA
MSTSQLRAVVGYFILVLLVCLVVAEEPFQKNTPAPVVRQSAVQTDSCANCATQFAALPEAMESTPRGSSPEISAAYVGNVKSHKFHRNSCRYAGCRNCTAKFKSREEALNAGFAPGGCCNP